MMSIKSHQKILINFALTIAFLFNAILPLLLIFDRPTSPDSDALAQIFNDKILICTSSGYKYISIRDLEKGDLSAGKDNFSSHCVLCLIELAAADLYVPEKPLIFPSLSISENIYFVRYSSALNFVGLKGNNSPRAPPVA